MVFVLQQVGSQIFDRIGRSEISRIVGFDKKNHRILCSGLVLIVNLNSFKYEIISSK
jgi:hypothetical protein